MEFDLKFLKIKPSKPKNKDLRSNWKQKTWKNHIFARNIKKNELARHKNLRNQNKTFSVFLTGFFCWGGKMTGFFGLFLGLDIFWNQFLSFRIKILLLLSLRRVQKFLVVTQVLILVPREGKNLFCPSDLEFLSLTAKNVEFLSLTLKNLEFLSLDSNFVLRLVTKTQGFLTFVTKTQHFLPFVTKTQGLRDKTNSYPPSGPKSKPSWPQEIFVPSLGTNSTKFWFFMTKINFKRYQGPKTAQKPCHFTSSEKKACQKNENVFFWFLKFLFCASSFFFTFQAKNMTDFYFIVFEASSLAV